MIEALTEALSRSVTAADLVAKTDATLSVTVDGGGDVSITTDESSGVHVRVVQHGRIGWAGGPADHGEAVMEAARRSARSGPALDLMLPVASPTATVTTESPEAAGAGPAKLLALARALADRLRGPGRRIGVWAERSAGMVRVMNTRGVTVEYRTTLAGAGLAVATDATAFDAPLRLWRAGTGLPSLPELEALAAEAERWLRVPPVSAWSPGRRQRAWLGPRAVRTVLRPVLQRLTGEVWLERADSSPPLDPRLTLLDDPLAPGRPGSRPICDDGVPTRTLTLIDRGRPVQGIVDLVTGARHGVPATGHGLRRILGAPRPSFSNLRLLPGTAGEAELAAAVGDGLLVLALDWGPVPNPSSGGFRARAPWTFLVRHGEIAGRLVGAVLSGRADELLAGVGAIGRDAEWLGAAALPSLVVEGLRLEEA